MRTKYLSVLTVILSLSLWSCETAFDDPSYSAGTANFNSFVSVGDSYSAGYADGALSRDGQVNSFPMMLSTVFGKVGGGAFKQALLAGANGDLGVSPSPSFTNPLATTPRRILAITQNCKGESGLGVSLAGPPNPMNVDFYTNYIGSDAPFNNMGVTGAKSFDLTRQSLGDPLMLGISANPFYVRMASVPGTSTMIDDAVLASPTFFSLWIGGNDLLGYATSGGSGVVDGTNSNDITAIPVFEGTIDVVVQKLTANGAKGILANIPDITGLPYFNTVPFNGLTLDAASAAALTAAYMGTGISFSEGENAFVIEDTSSVFGFRQIKSTEFLVLTTPSDSILCAGWGSQTPIPASYVLDEAEIMNVRNYTSAYNTKLKSVANANGLAFADMNAFFKSFENEFVFNGVDYSTEFIAGGAFSLDGVHPNKRGYAIIANEFIRAINATYNSTLPLLDVNAQEGIIFP